MKLSVVRGAAEDGCWGWGTSEALVAVAGRDERPRR
jgi:hypothetical protein